MIMSNLTMHVLGTNTASAELRKGDRHRLTVCLLTRNTCTQQPLARLPNLFSVMLRLHTAINRADFVSW